VLVYQIGWRRVSVVMQTVMWCDRKLWMTNLQLLNRTKSTWLHSWSKRQRSSGSHWMGVSLVTSNIWPLRYNLRKNESQVLILQRMMLCMSLVTQRQNVHRSMYVSLLSTFRLYSYHIKTWQLTRADQLRTYKIDAKYNVKHNMAGYWIMFRK